MRPRFRPEPTKADKLARLETYLANLPDATLFASTIDDIRRVIDAPGKDAEYRLIMRQQSRRQFLDQQAGSKRHG